MGLTKYNLGELLELTTEINSDLMYGPDDVRGMTITKEIIPTKADVANTNLSRFLVVHPNEFVFNPRTHGKKIGFGYNDTDAAFIISWNNIAFTGLGGVVAKSRKALMDEENVEEYEASVSGTDTDTEDSTGEDSSTSTDTDEEAEASEEEDIEVTEEDTERGGMNALPAVVIVMILAAVGGFFTYTKMKDKKK